MKAESLRIGNWVEYFGKNKQIDGIKSMSTKEGYAVEIISTDIHGNSISEYSPLDSLSLKPIPLTEEWLLRFGFESDNYELHETYLIDISRPERYDHDSYLKILVMDDDCYVDISEKEIHPDTIENNVNLKQIQYVHEVQNLYFVLTGEELKLKS